MSKTKVLRVVLLCLSALMVWEAFSPGTFTSVFQQPLKNWLELSYFAAMLGSLVFLWITVRRLLRRPHEWLKSAFHVLLAISWCLALLICSFLMGVRTGF